MAVARVWDADNSEWITIGGQGPSGADGADGVDGIGVAVVKANSESVTSSIALQDDDELFLAIGAGTTWYVRFILFVDGAAGGDISLAVTAPAGATGRYGVLGPGTTATTFENATGNNQATNTLGAAFPVGTLGAGNVIVATVEAAIVNPTNAGNIRLRWAQRVSDGTATRVLDKSVLIAHPA